MSAEPDLSDPLTCPPPDLLDMREALDKPPREGDRPGVRLWRRILDERPWDFAEKKVVLERAWCLQEKQALEIQSQRESEKRGFQGDVCPTCGQPPPKPDPGTEAALKLLDDILKGE